MPTKVFIDLDKEKQDRIIDAAINEFAEYGYENSSTNRIVRNCGISKGSLFKYFENKEELYFYLIDTISSQMASETLPDLKKLPKDLFDRVVEYSAAEISWYVANPVKGRFIIGVASEVGTAIGKKIIARYGEKSTDIYEALLKDVDMSDLHSSRKEVTDILRWVLKGFNADYLSSLSNDYIDIERVKKDYIKQLKSHLKVLKSGL
ncbi:MAG: TetR/AcrR family transcriptional regulator [Eubacterium sp.]|nr:TetR/AcrR family transcriptional regulator [Eubacterium sp.]